MGGRSEQVRACLVEGLVGKRAVADNPIEEKILDPKTGQLVEKDVFVIYFQGVKGPLHQKIEKVCHAVGAQLYKWPEGSEHARKHLVELNVQIAEKEKVIHVSEMYMVEQARDLTAQV